MNRLDPILAADDLQEKFARDALQCAQDEDELTDAWFAEADSFEGEARERLREEFALRLRQLGVSAE